MTWTSVICCDRENNIMCRAIARFHSKTIYYLNMKKIVLSALLITVFSLTAFSQSDFTVSLRVTGADSSVIDNYDAWIEEHGKPENRTRFNPSDEVVRLRQAGSYTIFVTGAGYHDFTGKYYFHADTSVTIRLKENIVEMNMYTVKAIAARDKSGFASSKLSAAQIAPFNLGQDFTFLLANTPSAVATSDAGNGVGYTGIRIRGSDATRINVTVNGIPINDAESHGVFWVNMPDLASSASTVQIQRGVGSSTIGTGSFGANINIQNTALSPSPFVQLQQSYGSFNTLKSTMQFGTGRINNFNFSGRLSKIRSDGYIDRAFSDLQSFQFNLNYIKNKWTFNAVSFGGKEKTYQSWYGTPESRMNNDPEGMIAYADRNYLTPAQRANLLNSGRTYNFYTYDNQTDNYWQNHYQLHIGHTFSRFASVKSSFFATTGRGFYEEYREGASFTSYGVNNYISGSDTQTSTNLVRQRWLDNIFYGNFSSFNYKKDKVDFIAGASYTVYEGKHFGKVIWAELASPFGKDYTYYRSNSNKSEVNTFLKLNYALLENLKIDAEAQIRSIQYNGKGNDNDQERIDFDQHYQFFNPKVAFVYELTGRQSFYGSYSIGNREPVRSDFTDNPAGGIPRPEHLQDLEFGYIYKGKHQYAQVNVYNMQYKDQLVVTGELNDVGSALRRNVPNSYRRGIELIWTGRIMPKVTLESNLTLSRNKIRNFEDIYYNYDSGTTVREVHNLTDIALSPDVIGFIGITDRHLPGTAIGLNCKYVGKQFLDNTLNNNRKINDYYTLNLHFEKTFKGKKSTILILKGMVNNLNSIYYSNNGYTFKYVSSGQLVVENFYYPQSLINFMLGLDFKF